MATENKPDVKTGFMCRVDYDLHLTDVHHGTDVYASEADLRSHRKCADVCGIVEVEVRLVRIVHKGEIL